MNDLEQVGRLLQGMMDKAERFARALELLGPLRAMAVNGKIH